MITLSVLDQSLIPEGKSPTDALRDTVRLAKHVESLGYHRFWVSEHHASSGIAGTSPEVLLSHLGAKTSNIRLGSGGVMLPHYSAYKVAENFKVLEALYPGRMDVGVGRAPGGTPLASRALQEDIHRSIDRYPEQIRDLTAYLHDSLPQGHRFAGLRAAPYIETAPVLWLLGSSGDSAIVAAEQGAAYAYAHFINPHGGTDTMRYYRQHFKPSLYQEAPKTLITVSVICADTEEEAELLARSMQLTFVLLEQGKQTNGFPSVETATDYPYTAYERMRLQDIRNRVIVGTPGQVKQQLLDISEAYQTDEIMIVTMVHDIEAKLKSYQLIADVFHEQPK
ncbi:LLM class flavin-dependent oxidoreductase [Paenibacillus sp. UMB4589-SE434]|uniref:LLM class flavin-dependent oxidoreductase n=1 Tax=Paenibacillus sp. UMB4589-SE434 TaxID=3046314 RepID=UPI00254DFC17|nr:LLM class flavin-dependent oxidoreductase [Paenibacillus sp. UMB4589-SE434]MDK8179358.1 LLM class flavin-dependent oxidoreductase [Paenibacillus sp. UMB4589-SE434]